MATRDPSDLGEDKRKLEPKLRMVANGDSRVNAARADLSSVVAVDNQGLLEAVPPPSVEQVAPLGRSELRATGVSADRGSLDAIPNDILASVFIETADVADVAAPALDLDHAAVHKGTVIATTVRLADLPRLAEKEGVMHIELGEPLTPPTPIISRDDSGEPDSERWHSEETDALATGDVLIGIIDVQGFDFAHPDFLNARGETRFEYIWDQGGNRRPPPKQRGATTFGYGAEFTRDQLNRAIRAGNQLGVPAYEVERQSQMADRSHATHVASIAAGNRGMCPRARLAGVLISLPTADQDRRQSFFDSTRVAHAVEYLLQIAEELRLPIAINVSLGTNGHAHDASVAVSRWIDSALAVPGRAVCVAAGNAGQTVAEFEGDLGYVMGRIHTSGRIAAAGLDSDIEWLVVGNGRVDVSENELEIWYGAQDRFAVSLLPPHESRWIGPVEPGQFIENRQLADGTMVSIYNELYNPANGINLLAIYLSPFFNDEAPIGVRAGAWRVRIHGREVREGSYHGWIERDDPRRHGRLGDKELWSFPSFFAEQSTRDESSVSSLACGRYVVAVANLDEPRGRISITSSQGPTRDGRFKPEVAAPGTEINAARGFAPDGELWVKMTGTSMASPFVCGVIGLMLATNPRLTAAQIGGILQRTSRPLPGGAYAWVNDAGFGVVNPAACVREAREINVRVDRTKAAPVPQLNAARGGTRTGRPAPSSAMAAGEPGV
jgi:subtilisin family serine protease